MRQQYIWILAALTAGVMGEGVAENTALVVNNSARLSELELLAREVAQSAGCLCHAKSPPFIIKHFLHS